MVVYAFTCSVVFGQLSLLATVGVGGREEDAGDQRRRLGRCLWRWLLGEGGVLGAIGAILRACGRACGAISAYDIPCGACFADSSFVARDEAVCCIVCTICRSSCPSRIITSWQARSQDSELAWPGRCWYLPSDIHLIACKSVRKTGGRGELSLAGQDESTLGGQLPATAAETAAAAVRLVRVLVRLLRLHLYLYV